MAAADFIARFHMQRHPEGGYYVETYRADVNVDVERGVRAASSAILFLVAGSDFSAFHRIESDELWHFHCGAPLEVVSIDASGALSVTKLGNVAEADDVVCQCLVRRHTWFASRLCRSPDGTVSDDAFALVGCTVSPAFDFVDFELAQRHRLLLEYPQHEQIINELTRAQQIS